MNSVQFMHSRRTALCVLAGLLILLATALIANQWLDYGQLTATLEEPLSRLRWIAGDISEVVFYKHELPALGLLIGACLAHWAGLRGYRWQGFAICYGSGLWPWVFVSSLFGLLISHLLWGWTLTAGIWQPTFVAFVSLPAAMVLLYGGGWQVAISGAVLGAVLVTPASLLMVNYICYPLELPAVAGNVSGMAVASILAFILCKRFPSLVRPAQLPAPVHQPANLTTEYYG